MMGVGYTLISLAYDSTKNLIRNRKPKLVFIFTPSADTRSDLNNKAL